jgi:HSP20 family molecular chaperone IbpA
VITVKTSPAETLAVDIVRSDEGFILVEVDVPGLDSRLDVRAHDHTVVVEGHRACRKPGCYVLQERARAFHRELDLPSETDMANLRARIHDGVLTISAPIGAVANEPGEHQIEVRPSAWACHPDAAAI